MPAEFWLRCGRDFHKEFDDTNDLPSEFGVTAVIASIYVSDATHPKVLKLRNSSTSKYAYYIVSNVYPNVKYALEFAYRCGITNGICIELRNRNTAATLYRNSIFATNIWKNHYKEITTSSACSVVEIRLGRAKAIATYYLIDDLKFQGNALLADPDDYSLDFPDKTFDHDTVNANVTRDRAGIHAQMTMQFPAATISTFSRLLQFAKSNSNEYGTFNDGLLPTITEYATLRTSKTFNYAGVTVGHAHNAYWIQTTFASPTSVGMVQGASFTITTYQRIATDNATYVTTAVTGTGKYGYHKYVWKVTNYASKGHVEKIAFKWKGNCQDNSNKNVDGVYLYSWDGNNWVLLDTSRTGDDQILSFTTSKKEIAQQFVDVVSKYVRLIVRTRGTKQTGAAFSIKANYVECAVNDQLANRINLRLKAKGTVTGAITLAKNVTDNQILTLDAATNGYYLGEDRRSVVLKGAAANSGDKIMAKYQAEYEVVVDRLSRPRVYGGPIASPRNDINLTLKTLKPIEE